MDIQRASFLCEKRCGQKLKQVSSPLTWEVIIGRYIVRVRTNKNNNIVDTEVQLQGQEKTCPMEFLTAMRFSLNAKHPTLTYNDLQTEDDCMVVNLYYCGRNLRPTITFRLTRIGVEGVKIESVRKDIVDLYYRSGWDVLCELKQDPKYKERIEQFYAAPSVFAKVEK